MLYILQSIEGNIEWSTPRSIYTAHVRTNCHSAPLPHPDSMSYAIVNSVKAGLDPYGYPLLNMASGHMRPTLLLQNNL